MHVFKYVLAGQQTESQAARGEASEKLFALENDARVLVHELVRVTLDGVLTLSLGKGLLEASDTLFLRLKAFPKELPRTFATSSHSRVCLIRPDVMIFSNHHLSPQAPQASSFHLVYLHSPPPPHRLHTPF